MHVLLIGLRCSGKTTVGRLLAQRLGHGFIDLDDRTAEVLNSPSPADALSSHGEPAFREAESTALRDALATPSPTVIALGGGTPTAPGATAMILDAQGARRAVVVYLRAPADILTQRFRNTNAESRPALTPAGTLDEVPTLFAQRDPLYRRLADRIMDATQPTESIVEQLTPPQRRC